jgi:hypothetical protein
MKNGRAYSGAGDGTRTRNLLITSQLLCQLSYASANLPYSARLRLGQSVPAKNGSTLYKSLSNMCQSFF